MAKGWLVGCRCRCCHRQPGRRRARHLRTLAKPAPGRLTRPYREKTGERLEVNGHGASFAIVSRGLLTLDTPIETDHAPVETFGDAVKWLRGQPKGTRLRCQAPFRTSGSEAAFIRLDPRGEPFLHDVGTTTTIGWHPMKEFDPTKPAMVHDRLNDRTFEWKPATMQAQL